MIVILLILFLIILSFFFYKENENFAVIDDLKSVTSKYIDSSFSTNNLTVNNIMINNDVISKNFISNNTTTSLQSYDSNKRTDFIFGNSINLLNTNYTNAIYPTIYDENEVHYPSYNMEPSFETYIVGTNNLNNSYKFNISLYQISGVGDCTYGCSPPSYDSSIDNDNYLTVTNYREPQNIVKSRYTSLAKID